MVNQQERHSILCNLFWVIAPSLLPVPEHLTLIRETDHPPFVDRDQTIGNNDD